jgi:tRNA-guanine family transglycosylase
MPVATQASLKGLTPEQLEDQGCRLCLNNTYHLYGRLPHGDCHGAD